MRVDQINPEQYQSLLADKVAETTELFSALDHPEINVVSSPDRHYRLRAEFRVWHQDEDSYYIMFDPINKEKFRVDYYLPGSELINSLMQQVREYVLENEILRRKLYQVDFLTTLSGEALVSLIYHKALDHAWQQEAKLLKGWLSQHHKVDIVGRARKQKLLIEKDYVTEQLAVDGQTFIYQQIENTFTQPNGVINQAMLTWARNMSAPLTGDLLELYCGNGNFSIALHDCFGKVLATEIAKPSVKSAQYNLQQNKIDNVVIGQASAEDFSRAFFDGKSVKSLKAIELSDYDFSTILVDPPRAGLDEDTVELVKRFDHILYISCNPETLQKNLTDICQTHDIVDFTFFDQFPYTHHIESGVFLTKKTK